jgi:hypothetical protein
MVSPKNLIPVGAVRLLLRPFLELLSAFRLWRVDMPFAARSLLLAAVAVACLLAPCSAQSGVNTTFYLDMNCTAKCDNCTVSNPIITAGGCVRERFDVNSSSITTSCNSTHVIGAPTRKYFRTTRIANHPPTSFSSAPYLAFPSHPHPLSRIYLQHNKLQRNTRSLRLRSWRLPSHPVKQRRTSCIVLCTDCVSCSAHIYISHPQIRAAGFPDGEISL